MPPHYSKDQEATAHKPASTASDSSESDSEDPSDQETGKSNDTIYTNNPALQNARDMALIAEERWLIEMLKSTRQQRNALKVEALYFQGLKADLYAKHAQEFGEQATLPPPTPLPDNNDVDVPIPELTYPELTPDLDQCFAPNGPLTAAHKDMLANLKRGTNKPMPSNLEDFAILEGECNSEELGNLGVDQKRLQETWDIEDPEYESEEEEAWSRVNIDMSMLVGYNDSDI